MSTINRLSSVDVLQPSDQIPVWDSSNGDTRKASMSTLLAFVESYFADPDYSTRIVAPAVDYFTVDIGATGDSIWMIVNPTLNFTNGAITLPPASSAVNDQQITVVFTSSVSTFVITSSGATVLGAPTQINGYDSFSVRYNSAQQTWYNIGTTGSGSGSGVSQIVRQDFTGDGTTTTFALLNIPSALGNELQIFIDGVYQERAGYTVSGVNIIFSEAPPSLSNIEVLGWAVSIGAETSANLVSYTPAGTGAVLTTVQAKLRESISVLDFGADPTGTTDSYTAIVAAIAALPASGGTLIFPKGTYLVNTDNTNGLSFTGKNNFVIEGRESTIKVVDGGAVTANREVMYFNTCSDGVIRDLIVDGNRSTRTVIGETSTFNVNISYSNSRLLFDNVRSINSTSDGFYLTSSASGAGTLSTYPTDITLRNCSADNSWRNGISAIASNRLVIEGGRYANSNGGGPEDGIDVEPDAVFIFGNKEIKITNVDLSGNAGWGLAMAGVSATTPNVNPVVSGVYGTENALGFLLIANADNGVFSNIAVGPHSATTRGVVDIISGASDVTLDGVTFDHITAAGASNYCIYQASGYDGALTIKNVTATSISCAAIFVADIAVIENIIINTCTDTKGCVAIANTAHGSVIRNATIVLATGNPIEVGANDVELDGITIRDYGASASAGIVYTADALRGIVRNASVFQSTAIPVGSFGIRYNTNAPAQLINFMARSAGTDYTSANVVGLVNGATLEGALLSGITPNIGSLTWTPVMKDGATVITTTTNYATYVRSGDIIHARCGITRTDATGLTGQLNITGLPYAGSGAYAACGTAWFDGNVAADFTAVVNLDASGVGQFLQTQTGVIGSIIVPTNLWEDTRGIYFSLTYDAVTT